MSRRILIVEPDPAGRALLARVMTAEGYAPEAVASVREAEPLLDAGAFELAIMDEIGGGREVLEEIRILRRRYPALPVIATGALLSPRVLRELLRLQAMDALAKPFTPAELREAVSRAFDRARAHHAEALEYAAAITAARQAVAQGLTAQVAPALRRAQAIAALDAEPMALWALLAELEGRDADADRGYRAALSLRTDEGTAPPDPYEGLARLSAYGATRPAASLRAERAGAPVWILTDPAHDLRAGPPQGSSPGVALMALGLTAEGPGAVFLRDGDGPLAFALMSGALRPGSVAKVLATLGAGPILADEATRARLDLAPLDARRGDHG